MKLEDIDNQVEKNPLTKEGGIKILRGNIAPNGAILKPSAASPNLMKHTGKAVVFESVEEFHENIHDPNLDVDENSMFGHIKKNQESNLVPLCKECHMKEHSGDLKIKGYIATSSGVVLDYSIH